MARILKKQKTSIKTVKAVKAKKVAKKITSKALKKGTAPKSAKKSVLKKAAVKKTAPTKDAKKKVIKSAKPAVSKTKQAVATAKPIIAKTLAATGLIVGSQVPHFSMPATLVGHVSQDDLKGKTYVLYFYPKDDTSGCTAEACEFRNTLPNFSQLGVTVIGVSKDTLESHEKFSHKYNLTFPLASDSATAVCESFGTWAQKSMYGRTYMGIERSTFVVDGNGIIRAVWRKVSVPGHIEDVRKAVESL